MQRAFFMFPQSVKTRTCFYWANIAVQTDWTGSWGTALQALDQELLPTIPHQWEQ